MYLDHRSPGPRRSVGEIGGLVCSIMVNLGGDGGGDSLTITKQCRDIL